MKCYPHPFYKGQNQDLSLAMGVNTLGRVEVELGGWVVKSYAGAVKKGKAITNCFDLPLTPSQTPCCEQPDRQVLEIVPTLSRYELGRPSIRPNKTPALLTEKDKLLKY